MVVVRLYGYFRECVGKREMNIDGKTVEEVLNFLIENYEGFSELLLESENPMKIKPYVKVMVNGRGIEVLRGMNTKLNNDDAVVIFPPVGGG